MIYSLVYISDATKGLTEQDLQEILTASRKNNPANNITGMLLYKDGEFMQVLEGPEENVIALYDLISDDPRHKDCTILSRKETPQRLFQDWTMGFKNIQNGDLLSQEGVSSFFDINYDKDDFLQSATAYNLLIRFYAE